MKKMENGKNLKTIKNNEKKNLEEKNIKADLKRSWLIVNNGRRLFYVCKDKFMRHHL